MNELYHHGIKGMHWGVRRYQNPDGTYTDAGKRRLRQLERDRDFDVGVVNANRRNASYHLRTGHPVQAFGDLQVAKALAGEARSNQRKIDRMNRASDKARRDNAKRQREWNAKNSALLSDEELTKQILRLQKEKQLKDLTNQAVTPGKKRVKDFLARNGELILSTAIAAGVTARINQGFKPKPDKYEDRKKELEIDTRLAKEGYPISKKGFTFDKETGTWIPKS